MTVCVAAICSWNPGEYMIVGASDRMHTIADLQAESDVMKIYGLSNYAVALLAGDPAPLIPICDAVAARIRAADDQASLTTRQIVDIFTEEHAGYRSHLAEIVHLRPLGLKRDWLAEHSHSETASQVRDFDLGSGNPTTIIAGRDPDGSCHLWQINKWGVPRNDDLASFSAIGTGEWHVASHLMLSRYSRFWPFQRALLAIYYAKRKSEVAPGIGRVTDLFYIGRDGFALLRPEIHDAMKAVVDRTEKRIKPVTERAEKDAREAIDKILAASAPPPAAEAPKGDWSGTDTAQAAE